MRAPTPNIEGRVGSGEPLHSAADDLSPAYAPMRPASVERFARIPQAIRLGNLDSDQKRALRALFVLE